MGIKRCISLIVLFLFIIPITLGKTDYNETGNFDGFFQQGTGFFNEQLTSIDQVTRTITEQVNTPLISDLDGDGVNEIIILDDNTFRLYHDKTLDIIDAFVLPANEPVSNFIVFDIDGDNFTEIIVSGQGSTEYLEIIEYNGTDFFEQNQIDWSGIPTLAHSNGEVLIKCAKEEKCALITTSHMRVTGATANNIEILFFNSTNVTNPVSNVISTAGTNRGYCFPRFKTIQAIDFDNDNRLEFIFSYTRQKTSVTQENNPTIVWVELYENNNSFMLDGLVDVNIAPFISSADCDTVSNNLLTGNILSNSLTFDIDGSSGNGLETVIAMMLDADEWYIQSYDGCSADDCTITTLDDYPENCLIFGIGTFNCPTGNYLSNIIKIDAFDGEEGTDDFCAIGYDEDESELDMICGSETQTEGGTETIEFVGTTGYNLSVNEDGDNFIANHIIHSAQHSTETTDGKNLPEIVTSYGIFALDKTGVNTLDRIFENPKQDAVVLSIDAEKVESTSSREDLIVLQSGNLWYLDDKFSNSPAEISAYSVNPCLDSTWKVNTTVTVIITVEDDDLNDVGARAILYQGLSNEQDSDWSANVSSGTSIPLNFIANTTVGVGNLRLMGRDVFIPDTVDTIDLTFSVAPVGVEFGDCITEVTVITEEEEEEIVEDATLTEDATSNVITRGILSIADLTNLGGTTLWLLGMLLMTVLIWYVMAEERSLSGNATLGTIAIANVLAIMLGARLSILGTGMVVIMVLISLVILAVFLGKFFTGIHSQDT